MSVKKYLKDNNYEITDIKKILNEPHVTEFLRVADVDKAGIMKAIKDRDPAELQEVLTNMTNKINEYKERKGDRHSRNMKIMSNESEKTKGTLKKGAIAIGGILFIMVTLTLLSSMLGGGKETRSKSKRRVKSKRRRRN